MLFALQHWHTFKANDTLSPSIDWSGEARKSMWKLATHENLQFQVIILNAWQWMLHIIILVLFFSMFGNSVFVVLIFEWSIHYTFWWHRRNSFSIRHCKTVGYLEVFHLKGVCIVSPNVWYIEAFCIRPTDTYSNTLNIFGAALKHQKKRSSPSDTLHNALRSVFYLDE